LVGIEPASMTAVFCHNADDRKAETWKQQLKPFARLEFAVSDAAKGIAAAVEQIAEGRDGAPSAPASGHGLDIFHTAKEAQTVLARQWRQAEAARVEAEAADAQVDRAREQGLDARGPAGPARAAWRERHIVVDSMGSLLAVLVTAADVDDAKAAAELFTRLGGQPMGRVKRMYADTKYHNFTLYEWVEKNVGRELTIVRRPKGAEGWVLLPIRWTVERTFAWLGKCRRLSKDREKSVRSSEAFVKLAMIHMMLNRLEPKGTDADFTYRSAA
jgi:transposase